ncbi:hypothetical protein PVAP13_7KG100163 [Panicum virgatum]|uniref:Uncharacterized protein n=1 Tax=Panicum virgatum TaxID=38727 RepID=A0A8T0QKJ3_PANVG|nr:hypothetical protein PVAP13_7KG100163 [Panicum virgatum]
MGSNFFFAGSFFFGGCIVLEDCARDLFGACFAAGGCSGGAWGGVGGCSGGAWGGDGGCSGGAWGLPSSSLAPPELNGCGGDGERA